MLECKFIWTQLHEICTTGVHLPITKYQKEEMQGRRFTSFHYYFIAANWS